MSSNILEINGLKKYFPINKGFFKKKVGDVKAVDDISLKLERGTTLAIVGESGSGKTTLAKTVMRFYNPTEGTIN
ncbi:ATP-binding cassette domain-containing protein, partial [Butyricicoccus sp. 1XD8-22]